MLAPPYDAQALSEGFNLLAQASDHIPDYPTTGCWARQSWVEKNRDKMSRFARAFVRATDWLLLPQNRDETLKLLQAYQNLTREQAETKLAQVVAGAAIDPAGLNRVVQLESRWVYTSRRTTLSSVSMTQAYGLRPPVCRRLCLLGNLAL